MSPRIVTAAEVIWRDLEVILEGLEVLTAS